MANDAFPPGSRYHDLEVAKLEPCPTAAASHTSAAGSCPSQPRWRCSASTSSARASGWTRSPRSTSAIRSSTGGSPMPTARSPRAADRRTRAATSHRPPGRCAGGRGGLRRDGADRQRPAHAARRADRRRARAAGRDGRAPERGGHEQRRRPVGFPADLRDRKRFAVAHGPAARRAHVPVRAG